MLEITIYGDESWDARKEEFIPIELATLELEHSLVSLSKWESKFEKPFLGAEEKSTDEVMDYVRFMILTPKFPPEVFHKISQYNLDEINTYINAKNTATWFREVPGSRSREVITSELIYYWMIAFNIPFECQHWHLNRLFTLIRVCSEKNAKPKKRSRSEMLAERQMLNQERRARFNTKG